MGSNKIRIPQIELHEGSWAINGLDERISFKRSRIQTIRLVDIINKILVCFLRMDSIKFQLYNKQHMNTPIAQKKLTLLVSSNILLTIILGLGILKMLQVTQEEYITAFKEGIKKVEIENLKTELDIYKQKNDTTQVKKLETQIVIRQQGLDDSHEGVTFYIIVVLMILAGGLGGVLCNLRGFFMQFRKDEGGFPKNLEVPYYVRPFMGAGAGLFIYFVANFLITSITVTYEATNIPFQGMVSFMALAILAGFGSLEFFQRLKETALSLFGQKAEKDKWQKIEDLYALWKKGVISEEEFNVEKAKLVASSIDVETYIQKSTIKPEK